MSSNGSEIIRRSRYKKGDWLGICDLSGQKCYMSDLKPQWNGLMVMRSWWSPKQPQQEIKPRPDHPARSPVRSTEPQVGPLTPFTNSDFL